MNFLTAIGKVFKICAAPIEILGDYAKEPLKKRENEREQANRDREVEREIRQQTGVESVKSELRRKEAEHSANLEIQKQTRIARINAETEQWAKDQEFRREKELTEATANLERVRSELRREEAEQNADLEIRMQTEIERIHVETEQWKKDKEFERVKNVVEAVIHYKERLTELHVNTINAIGNMSIDLRKKANDLISSKIKEYKSLEDQAIRDAEDDFLRITEKFSNNEQVMNIMIGIASQKIANYVNATAHLIDGLSKDIEDMKGSIDMLTQSGQVFIDRQVEQFNQFKTFSLPNEEIKKIQ